MHQIIAAVNDARIDERRGFDWHTGTYPVLRYRVNEESAPVAVGLESGMMCAESKKLEGEPDCGESANDAQSGVGTRYPDFAAPEQEDAFVSKGGEGREPAKQARKQKQPRLRREEVAMLDKGRERANHKTTGNVDNESAQREAPGGRMMQNHSPEFVTCN